MVDLNGIVQPWRKETYLVLALVFWEKYSVHSDNDTKHILIFAIAQLLSDLPNLRDQFLQVEQEGGWVSCWYIATPQLSGFKQ